MAFIKDQSEDMKIEETFRDKHEDTEEQTCWFSFSKLKYPMNYPVHLLYFCKKTNQVFFRYFCTLSALLLLSFFERISASLFS